MNINQDTMPKIKVLMVLATTNIGGAEMFVLNLLRKMDMTRFQVDVVANFKEQGKGISEELKALGCKIYYLPYFRVVNYFQYVKAWDDFLTEHHYDIVHGHASNSAGIYLRIAKKHGCKTIAHSHSAGFRGNMLQRVVKAVLASKVKYVADYWFACSGKAAEHLYGKSYKEYANYYTIPNAIDAEKYVFSEDIRKRIRREHGVSEDCFLCGHVGSLTQPKNHMFLLDVFAEVLKQKPEAKLLLCGDGPLREDIEKKATALGISDNVIFAGVVRNANEYMMAMDVLVFPSIFEGFPITVIEAEATGLPIVMSDVITKEVDIVENVRRLSLKAPASVWASTILNSHNDDRKGQNGMIASSIYNMKNTIQNVMGLYEDMTKKKLALIVNVDWFFMSHRLPLALHALKEGWEVYLLTKDTGKKEELEGMGIKFIDIPFGRTTMNPIQELKCLLTVRKELKRIKPDVIHNVTWKGCLWGGIAAKMTGNHHVVNALSGLGSVVIGDGIVNKIMGRLADVAFKNDYAAFIFQNPDDLKWFKDLGYATDDRIFMIKGSGIDLNVFAYKEATAKEKLKVLFPARMLRDKGLCELIEAFGLLKDRYEGKIELVLAGSCGDANKTAISEDELKGMLVNGYITWIGNQADMYPVYVDSDIVVLPSYREGLPKALIEACAVGRPIVTTDVPGCRECVDEGINGYLVPLKSSKELAEAIEKLVLSPEDRIAFGLASRKKAEMDFSIENVIGKTFDIYNFVMDKSK